MDDLIKVDFDIVQQFSDELYEMTEMLQDKRTELINSIVALEDASVGAYSDQLNSVFHDLLRYDATLWGATGSAYDNLSGATKQIYDADLKSYL